MPVFYHPVAPSEYASIDFLFPNWYYFITVFVQLFSTKTSTSPNSPFSLEVFMRSFVKSALPAMVIGLFIIAGCGKKDSGTGPVTASSVVGMWSISDATTSTSISYVFQSNNTYAMTVTMAGASFATENGTYTVSGNQVVMTCSSTTALGMTASCGPNTTGTISGNRMTIPSSGGGSPTTVTKQ
jgi:hypothetical protein